MNLLKHFAEKIKNTHSKVIKLLNEKAEQNKRIQIRQESVSCPHCKQTYNGSYYGEHTTKLESIEFNTPTGSKIDINFLKCSTCKKLFGVKTTHYYDPVPALIRESFCLTD